VARWLLSAPLLFGLATCTDSLAPSQQASATVTIRAEGMTPKEVTLNRGNRVSILNLDSQPHRPMSDPHPEHSPSCAALDFDTIAAGARAESAVINDSLDCRLHDEMNAGSAAFTTRILIGQQ
jgi:hypothetical protein